MSTEKNIVYCSRCGAEMEARSRYCMKCGNLNESHPENNKYSKVLKKINKGDSGYQIGSGKKIFNKGNNRAGGINMISENNSDKKIFLIVNIAIIALLCLVSLIPLFSMTELSVDAFLNTGVLTNLFFVGFFTIFFVSGQILFIKMDIKWWAAFIPFYNLFLLCKALFNNGLLFILMLIPGVNIIFSIILLYKLGASFKKSGFLTVILPIIMIPIISFGSSAFNGIYYVTEDSDVALEKSYGSYYKFADFGGFLILLGIIGYLFTNNNYLTIGNNSKNMSLVIGGKTAIRNVKKAIENKKVTCVDKNGNNVSIKKSGTYYFYSNDFLYDYGLKTNLIDASEGYVKVEYSYGEYVYYIAMSVDNNGIRETDELNLNIESVEKKVKIKKPKGIMCSIEK